MGANVSQKTQKTLTESKISLENQSINKTYEIRESNAYKLRRLRENEVDYTIFDTKGDLKYRKEASLYGGIGARDTYFELCDLAFKTGGNVIAVRREYLMAILERATRTIRLNINTLQEMRLIEVVNNKHGFVYVALKDWREAMEYQERDYFKRTIRPTFYYQEANRILRNLSGYFCSKKFKFKGKFALGTEGKHFRLKSASISRMKYFNDVLLEFSPIDDSSTTFTFSYAQITGHQLPSLEACYRRGIIEKRLSQALLKRCLEIDRNFTGEVA